MKNILLVVLVLFLSACSSDYNPSEKMLAYKKNMTIEQAKQVLQQAIWADTNSKGICGARGFWYDESSDMRVHDEEILILAHKRGREIKKDNPAYKGIVVFEKQYYMYHFKFKKVVSIEIYDDPLLLSSFQYCNKKNHKEDYRVIDLYVNKLDNLKFILPNKDFDKVVAALSLLISDRSINIH